MPKKTEAPITQELRELCATAYQVVGSCYGPYELLDNLEDAAQGRPLRHDPGAGLPFVPNPIAQQWNEVRGLLNADGRYEEADLEQMRKLFYVGANCCWNALFGGAAQNDAVSIMWRYRAVERDIHSVVGEVADAAAAHAR